MTVCRAGSRSAEAAEWLRSLGFDAQNLDGGMLAWKWAGLPLTGGIVEPDPKPERSSPEMQALHNDFLEIALAVQERFGVGVQPSEEEILGLPARAHDQRGEGARGGRRLPGRYGQGMSGPGR